MKDKKDSVYKKKIDKIKPFEFNEDVANVFDDMLNRSIPFYNEIHKIICDLAGYYIKDNDLIYDLGSSTGETIILLNRYLHKLNKKNISYIGVDNSFSMIKKCQQKLKDEGVQNYQLINEDLNKLEFHNSKTKAQMIIMNYTLQFLKNNHRPILLQKIYSSLKENGIFILSEKIIPDNKNFDTLLTNLYYDFKKRNGYSELEISQKREALEEVLKPNSPGQQKQDLLAAGFSKVEIIFRWYNFASYLCVK